MAAWLTDWRNALLRRSIVNRVLAVSLGRGIVDSPNDFGWMGSLPTHPELLEWLAKWFTDEGTIAEGIAPVDRDERSLPAELAIQCSV